MSIEYQNSSTDSIPIQSQWIYSFNFWLWLIAPPIIIVLGTIGNLMILLVLQHLGSGSTNLFLRALAISDLIILYNGFFGVWIGLAFNVIYTTIHDVICKLVAFGVYFSGVLSAWLVVAMTVQRAFSVVWPHRVSILCTRRNTYNIIIGIICFVIVLHVHMLYGNRVVSTSNSTSLVCGAEPEYRWFMLTVWSWMDLLCFSLMPFVLLVISNSVLVWKLKTSVQNVTLSTSQSNQSVVREKRTSSITITLITVSVIFLTLTLPNSLYLISFQYLFAERYAIDMEFRPLVDMISSLTSLIWYSNSAVNFYIYCLTGSKFRGEFKKIMCGCLPRSTQTDVISIQNTRTCQIGNIHNGSSALDKNEEF